MRRKLGFILWGVLIGTWAICMAALLINLGQAQSPQIFGGKVEQAGNSLSGILMPRADVVFLDSENNIYIQRACTLGLMKVAVNGTSGTLIGIDYRPGDGQLYGLDDTNKLYVINLSIITRNTSSYETSRSVQTSPVSGLTIPFAGDARSLMDYNPVLNALRLIGANDQNYAVVNSGGHLNLTASQNPITYISGDPNRGINPNLVGGAYTNNVAGATTTIFYGIDYALDSLVTIAELNVTGSSNTGGGKLRTIGRLIRGNKTFDLGPTADFDIYTVDGVNRLIGVNGNTVFTLTLPPPFASPSDIPVRSLPILPHDHFLDVSVGPAVACEK